MPKVYHKSLLLFFFLPPFIKAFLDPSFLSVIKALNILILMIIPMFLVSIFDYILIIFNLQWKDFFITLGAGLLNVLLDLILVPKFGGVGAAWASVVSQYVNLLFTIIYTLLIIKRYQYGRA